MNKDLKALIKLGLTLNSKGSRIVDIDIRPTMERRRKAISKLRRLAEIFEVKHNRTLLEDAVATLFVMEN